MKIVSILFSSFKNIKVCCYKTDATEIENIASDFVKYTTIKYKIGLISDPEKCVEEIYRIRSNNIEFMGTQYFILSFPVDSLLNPDECQINIISLMFFCIHGRKIEIHLDCSFTFLEMQNNSEEEFKKVIATNKRKQEIKPVKVKDTTTITSKISHKKDKRLFIDSFEGFKDTLKDTKLLELVESREDSVEFNLKNFGMSILCTLLLLVKYLNVLVDNDFQEDLNKFLISNIIEHVAEEVMM